MYLFKLNILLFLCLMQQVDFCFKFNLSNHNSNEELGRHRRRNGKNNFFLLGNECENVSHVLWECSA